MISYVTFYIKGHFSCKGSTVTSLCYVFLRIINHNAISVDYILITLPVSCIPRSTSFSHLNDWEVGWG